MESERKSSGTETASRGRLASSQSVAFFWTKCCLKPPRICDKFKIPLSLFTLDWIGWKHSQQCFHEMMHFNFPSFYLHLLPQHCSILFAKMSLKGYKYLSHIETRLVILEILIPDNTLNHTVTQHSGLTLCVPPQLCELWSIPLISNNFSTENRCISHLP